MGAGEVFSESLLKAFWQGDDAMFAALAIVDGDGALTEIDVFYTESEGFHNAQAGAIHDLTGEFPRIFQMSDDGANFGAGHHDRRAALARSGSEVIKGEFFDSKDVFDEKDHGIECLFLGGWGDVAFEGEELEVSRDGGRSCGIRGLAEFLETEADEAAIPVNVGFLGCDGEALEPDGAAESINEFGESGFGFGIRFRWQTCGQDAQYCCFST